MKFFPNLILLIPALKTFPVCAYKMPSVPSPFPLFPLARDASRRKKSLAGVRSVCERIRSIPAALVSPSPSLFSYPLLRYLAHPTDHFSDLPVQRIDESFVVRISPTPPPSPAPPRRCSRRNSTPPFTLTSSPSPSAPRLGLRRPWESLHRRRRPVQCRTSPPAMETLATLVSTLPSHLVPRIQILWLGIHHLTNRYQ
jgi:hypothetical protein